MKDIDAWCTDKFNSVVEDALHIWLKKSIPN